MEPTRSAQSKQSAYFLNRPRISEFVMFIQVMLSIVLEKRQVVILQNVSEPLRSCLRFQNVGFRWKKTINIIISI